MTSRRRRAGYVLLGLAALVACDAEHGEPEDTAEQSDSGADDTAEDTAGTGDTAPPDTDTGPADADGDGWPDAEDCAPADASIHPSANETCDGRDEDCDGAVDDVDEDVDGFLSAACGGDDCDDGQEAVHPGADEVCDNGLDDDCDGTRGDCAVLGGEYALGDADAILLGESAEGMAGNTAAGLGDVDGDGVGDLVVGAPYWRPYGYTKDGAVYVVLGGANLAGLADLGDADLVLRGDTNGMLNVGAPAGDVDGDGRGELWVVAPGAATSSGLAAGLASLLTFSGGYGSLTNSTLAILEGISEDAPVLDVRVGDLSGDGVDDVAVGTWGQLGAYVLAGPNAGLKAIEQADGAIMGGSGTQGDYLADGDYDGDGVADFVLSHLPLRGDDPSFVYVFRGPILEARELGDTDLIIASAQEGDQLGYAMSALGDVDGDGLGELALGAKNEDAAAVKIGAVYVLAPSASGDAVAQDVALASYLGYGGGDALGVDVCAPGDVDGDGIADLLMTTARYGGGELGGGSAFLVYGPFGGSQTADAADALFIGGEGSEGETVGCARSGDVNGDARPDILLTQQTYASDSGENVGRAVVFFGHGL